jgi:hypothetical protein
MFTDNVQMGGFSAGVRFRPIGVFALDVGLGIYGGSDWNDNARVEVPLTVDALFFVNPRSRVQFYLLAGVGASWAHAGFDVTGYGGREYTYLGGEGGLGLEFRLSRHFAINTDFRAFLRGRVDDNPYPEFERTTAGGLVQTTDVSGGVRGTFGATIYF